MAETPAYNHVDIKRYLQHNMSPQEMHAFEKALMDDPFLADAMEGFAAGNTTLADTHLTGIEEQLTSPREKAKVVPLIINKTAWWKIAAIVLIMGTGGFISYSLFYKPEHNRPLAQQMSADSTRVTARQPDSAVPAAKKPLPEQEIALNKNLPALPRYNSPVIKPSAMAKAAPSVSYTAKADTIATNLAGRIAGVSVSDSDTTAFRAKEEKGRSVTMMKAPSVYVLQEFKGKVTDMNGEPVSYATVIDSITHTGTVTDANGNFVMKVPDTITRVMVNDPDYSFLTATINSKAHLNTITLEKRTQSLSEVVIGYGSLNKKKIAAPDSSGSAEPVGGWKKFEQYLNRQIDSLQAKDSKNLYNNQNIVLEFSIDDAGKPSDIKVKEETNKAVAGKAMEILSNGPKWTKKKKDKTVKVVIPLGQVK